MKKLLGILVIGLLWCNVGFAEDRETCAEYAGKAMTEGAARSIMGACLNSDGFTKSKRFKCAIKSGKANTPSAARSIMGACLNS